MIDLNLEEKVGNSQMEKAWDNWENRKKKTREIDRDQKARGPFPATYGNS